jgi:hypothetical protein
VIKRQRRRKPAPLLPNRATKKAKSALTGLEAPLRLIDHINAAFAAHDTVVAVTPAQRFQ